MDESGDVGTMSSLVGKSTLDDVSSFESGFDDDNVDGAAVVEEISGKSTFSDDEAETFPLAFVSFEDSPSESALKTPPES